MNKRKNEWVPEDRLRATLFSAGVLAPLSVIFAGVVTQYVKGTTGIVLTLICFFVNGVGVSKSTLYIYPALTWCFVTQINSIFTVTSAYAVDAYQSRSAEAIAAIK